jgi:superfamily II DNA or RNA helicase
MAGGGKAPHLTVQRVGRGMRLSEGKERLFVFDFLDEGKYLKNHAGQRERTYNDQPAYTVATVNFEEVCP